ncbi:hypothetical protein SA496_20150 [Pseudomonas sp. JS3066]|uniref:hypothetical protein n=1 Tax=Pseudomonas sp. JS3066 TaxID=3090665 RepID=UPI002E7B15A4|nr:hypothetical protein [Pseudomonas sp. JS3066]WVK92014.1 hypothetical protein SA496_20150 [Pseudomonas sp. JS3066]
MASPSVEIANDFFHDCQDFLHRYRLTVESFYAVKSKRMKLFLDLRMAAECLMKAYLAYNVSPKLSRRETIGKIEKYSHKINKLATDVKGHIDASLWAKIEPFVQPLNALPVGLRYRLDGYDFRELNEEFYYSTVGSDDWLNALHAAIAESAEGLNKKLQNHSRIVTIEELLPELLAPSENKYAGKT